MPVNPDQSSLENKIMELERRVRDLERANPLQNATVTTGGITFNGGGFDIIDATDGHTVMDAGVLPPAYNRTGGVPQTGVIMNREDGSPAVILADSNPLTPPYKQAFQLYDRNGNVIIADDTNGGFGLANPNLSDSFFVNSNYTTWPATNATSFTTIAYTWYMIQNPQVQWSIDYTGDVGVAGQFRMMATPDNGAGTRVQVGTTQSQGTSGSFGFWSYYGVWGFTINSARIGSYVYVELQAKVTSGTGKMYAVCSQFGGGQS